MTTTTEQAPTQGAPNPKRSPWGDDLEDTGEVRDRKPRKKFTRGHRIAAWAAGATLVAGAGVGIAANTGNGEGEGPDVDAIPVPTLVVSGSQKSLFESGVNTEEVEPIMSDWIGNPLNGYFQNAIRNYENVDQVPFDSISDNPNSAIVTSINEFVKDHINDETIGGVWLICPEYDAAQADPTCLADGELIASDINIGPTNESYDAYLGIVHASNDGQQKEAYEVLVGNGDGSSIEMYVTDKNELKTR